jgi:hypothetical protein
MANRRADVQMLEFTEGDGTRYIFATLVGGVVPPGRAQQDQAWGCCSEVRFGDRRDRTGLMGLATTDARAASLRCRCRSPQECSLMSKHIFVGGGSDNWILTEAADLNVLRTTIEQAMVDGEVLHIPVLLPDRSYAPVTLLLNCRAAATVVLVEM